MEDQEHLRGPTADAAHSRQVRDDLFVFPRVELLAAQLARGEVSGEAPDGGRLLSRKPRAPHLLFIHGKDGGRRRESLSERRPRGVRPADGAACPTQVEQRHEAVVDCARRLAAELLEDDRAGEGAERVFAVRPHREPADGGDDPAHHGVVRAQVADGGPGIDVAHRRSVAPPAAGSNPAAGRQRSPGLESRLVTNPFSLEGKTALITGASRGIGLAIAWAFVDSGAKVIMTARGAEALHAAARQLGLAALAIPCDNADPARVTAMVEEAWRLSPVDILVNNAGISPYYKRAEHVTVEEWDEVMDVNARGAYFCSVEVAKRMFEAGRPGSIVNISSIAGVMPLERQGVYAASKAAVHQFTKVMALEWADRGVRVNAVAPGWTETEFVADLFASRHGEGLRGDIPMDRMAEPGDIAGAALYLASDASSYVTGTIITVDGGRALR
ncbi:MAG: hypothetical protein C0506_06060 [Anaerolinea sp.]|nr:hypothetical protein [Anaerolinea sp.]